MVVNSELLHKRRDVVVVRLKELLHLVIIFCRS